MDVSVIVCCFNSACRLRETFWHLARQEVPSELNWELVIVDNASTDATVETAKALWAEFGSVVPITIVSESEVGLASARRSGVMSASGRYSIFCDDDNWLAPSYISTATSVMDEDDAIGGLGGASSPVFGGDARVPIWFWSVANDFAVGTQSFESGDVTARGYLWGAGLCVRTEFLKRIYQSGLKPKLCGRKGGVLLSGDDSEICKWILLAGHKLWYDQRLEFQHFIPAGRQNQDYVNGIQEGFRNSASVLAAYDAHIHRLNLVRAKKSVWDYVRLLKANYRTFFLGKVVNEQVDFFRSGRSTSRG